MDALPCSTSARGVATITLNRPDRANAYDADMLDALAARLERLGADPAVRIVVLRGAGKHFSAGAAISDCRRPARSIREVCALLDALPKPTIAVVQGACIGGALALACCCDMLLAARAASFAIPEVRLGFAPGPLIPVFARALGIRALRRYLLSGNRFSAEEALRLGLVHRLCDDDALESALAEAIDNYLLAAPNALARAKLLLRQQSLPSPSEAELRELQAAVEATAQSEEAAEGRLSFQEKRKPRWYPPE